MTRDSKVTWTWDRIAGIVWIGFAVFGLFTDSSTSWVMSCVVVSAIYNKSADLKKMMKGAQ
jgi:hypothetical protein